MKRKKDTLEQVKEFSDFFGHPFHEKITFPTQEQINLRIRLSLEETTELSEACGQAAVDNYIELLLDTALRLKEKPYPKEIDIYGVADAYADKRYIDDGGIGLFGLAKAFHEIFDDVHSANMSKRTDSLKTVIDSISSYAEKGIEAYYEEKEGFYLIFRKEDNKVLKPVSWREPNNKAIIDKYL